MPRSVIRQQDQTRLVAPKERRRAALSAPPAMPSLTAPPASERQPGDDTQPEDYESQDG